MVTANRALERHVAVRYRELRAHGGHLRILSSDGPRAHGLRPTLAIVDELHAHRDPEFYVALRTALGKLPGARLLTISTAGHDLESVLGRLRARALSLPGVERYGHADQRERSARGSFALLEWACDPGRPISPIPTSVKAANPATWVSREWLAEQVHAPGVHPLELARYHANVWTDSETSWLPSGAWQRLRGDAEISKGETILRVGVDVGGERSGTAVAIVSDDGRVRSWVWQGDAAVLDAADHLRALRARYRLRRRRLRPVALSDRGARVLEREGVPMVKVPQTPEAMTLPRERLYASIVQGELVHDGDPVLASHVARRHGQEHARAGGGSCASRARAQIDAAIALAIANTLRLSPRARAQFVGFLMKQACNVCGAPSAQRLCPAHRRGPRLSGWAWARRVADVLRRDPICRICHRRRAVTADHVVRVADGGADDLSNLRGVCADCHRRRHR